jgi:N6-L-threonylcarbamoyladenine synthase
LKLDLKSGQSFRDAAFMGSMRWAFYNRLKAEYSDAGITYGCITKNTRIRNGLEKDHAVDSRCISGNPPAVPLDAVYMQKAERRRYRRLHEATIN